MFFEEAQTRLIAILQDRTKPVAQRVSQYIEAANEYQKKLNKSDITKDVQWLKFDDISFDNFIIRFDMVNEMELLRQVWQDYKNDMKDILNENDYEIRLKEYMESADYRENDIEQLLVYFTFRYIMNSIYDSNIIVNAYLCVIGFI